MKFFVHSKHCQASSLCQKNYGDTNIELSLLQITEHALSLYCSEIAHRKFSSTIKPLSGLWNNHVVTIPKTCHGGKDHSVGLTHWPVPQSEDNHSVCRYSFGSCTVPVAQWGSTPITPCFCQCSHTIETSSTCYGFTQLYHYFIHHKELNWRKVESTQQILLANSSFIFKFQCYVKPCQIHLDSVQNHFSIFCITLPITFYAAFLTSVTVSLWHSF